MKLKSVSNEKTHENVCINGERLRGGGLCYDCPWRCLLSLVVKRSLHTIVTLERVRVNMCGSRRTESVILGIVGGEAVAIVCLCGSTQRMHYDE